MISEVQKIEAPPIAVAGAEDTPVLAASCRAKDQGIMEAILVGDGPSIEAGLQEAGRQPGEFRIGDYQKPALQKAAFPD